MNTTRSYNDNLYGISKGIILALVDTLDNFVLLGRETAVVSFYYSVTKSVANINIILSIELQRENVYY